MASPTTGYDLTNQLGKSIKRAEQAAVSALGTTGQTTTPTPGTKAALAELPQNLIASAAKSASEKLQQQLAGKMNKVNALAAGVNTVTQLARNGSLAKLNLKGLAGKMSKAGGGILKKTGLGDILSGNANAEDAASAANASTQLINAKLADTIFTAFPTEQILAVDAYGVKDNDTLNNVIGKLSGFASNLLGSGGGLGNIGRDLTRMVLSTDKLSLNTDALKDRLISSLGGRSGIIDSLSRTVRDSLSELGLPSQVYDSIEATVRGTTSYLSSNNVQSASQLFGLIERVTGDSELAKFLDVGAEATLLSTVFRESIDLGLPDAIDAMYNQASSSEAAYYALQSNIVVAADRGELQTIDTMITKLGAARVLADCPDVIARVLASYRFEPGVTYADYEDLFTAMNSVFVKLDDHWGFHQRGGVWVTDMTAFERVSDDARTLLSNVGPFTQVLRLASFYPSQELIEIAKRNYPYVVV